MPPALLRVSRLLPMMLLQSTIPTPGLPGLLTYAGGCTIWWRVAVANLPGRWNQQPKRRSERPPRLQQRRVGRVVGDNLSRRTPGVSGVLSLRKPSSETLTSFPASTNEVCLLPYTANILLTKQPQTTATGAAPRYACGLSSSSLARLLWEYSPSSAATGTNLIFTTITAKQGQHQIPSRPRQGMRGSQSPTPRGPPGSCSRRTKIRTHQER